MSHPYIVWTESSGTQSVKFIMKKVTVQTINSLKSSILFLYAEIKGLNWPMYIRISMLTEIEKMS